MCRPDGDTVRNCELGNCRQLVAGLQMPDPDLLPQRRSDDLVGPSRRDRRRYGLRDDGRHRVRSSTVRLVHPARIDLERRCSAAPVSEPASHRPDVDARRDELGR